VQPFYSRGYLLEDIQESGEIFRLSIRDFIRRKGNKFAFFQQRVAVCNSKETLVSLFQDNYERAPLRSVFYFFRVCQDLTSLTTRPDALPVPACLTVPYAFWLCVIMRNRIRRKLTAPVMGKNGLEKTDATPEDVGYCLVHGK
jgi:hypothetical protein